MKQRQLLLGIETRFGRHELEDIDPVQIPTVARRDGAQLALALRQGDVQATVAATRPLDQKLQCQCRLSGAGAPFEEIDTLGFQAAAQDIVEPAVAG